MRLLIPVNQDNGKESTVCDHFGHAPFFIIYDTDTKSMSSFENKLDHSNDKSSPVDQIMVHNIDMLYTMGVGQRAIDLFKEKNVRLKTGKYQTVKDIIENINDLDDLESGCGH